MTATPSGRHERWDEEVRLTVFGSGKAYSYVWLVFEFLSLVAVLGFFAWSLFIRQPRADASKPLPRKALVGSILSYTGALVTNIIALILSIVEATVKESYVVISILNLIFYLITFLLGFFVFWYLVHKLLERVTETSSSNISRMVAMAHWVILVIFVAIAIAECAVYIASVAENFIDSYASWLLTYDFNNVSSALTILFWVASIEILCWYIFIAVKAGTEKRTNMIDPKTGVPAIAVGALFFFVSALVSAIVQIAYVLEMHLYPKYLNAATSIIEFVCIVGIYTGLLVGFQQWSRSGFISGPKDTVEDYERQMVTNDSTISSAPSVRSQHATFHSPGQQQMRYSVPEGAAASQQVHMWS